MREIIFDTETTGFEPSEGHRLVELGAIEVFNHVPTGQVFHEYINPERDIPADATRVHGITNENVRNCPVFAQIADRWLEFIGSARLVAHNATFDMKFINAELAWADRPALPPERFLDTLALARKKYPGAPASLDALCRRFNIDNSHREKHGALLDSELLAEVYLELCGGRQPGLALAGGSGDDEGIVVDRPFRPARPHAASPDEEERHRAFVLKKVKAPIWFADEKPDGDEKKV